jgi:hypothetical protein
MHVHGGRDNRWPVGFCGSDMRLDVKETVGRDGDGIDPALDKKASEGRVVARCLTA